MRHQERNVSEFDEIITYPPSAAPSGEKQVMSCVQAFTAALGFAMSAGWDWLPSMHTLWLRDYIEAVSMPTPFGFFGTLSGSIFFKMIMLLALCPVMERLFHAFPFVTRQTVLCTTPFSFGMKKLGKSILWHTVCINKKAGACSRLSVYAVFIRSAAILAYSGESSMPTHLLPVAFAARAVEPPPRKGSSTVPPSGTTPMSSAMS